MSVAAGSSKWRRCAAAYEHRIIVCGADGARQREIATNFLPGLVFALAMDAVGNLVLAFTISGPGKVVVCGAAGEAAVTLADDLYDCNGVAVDGAGRVLPTSLPPYLPTSLLMPWSDDPLSLSA